MAAVRPCGCPAGNSYRAAARRLEIFVQTFDHGVDEFNVPGSSANCLLWPTARGGPQRTGSRL